MLISLRHLVDRLRHPRSRADELAQLRARAAAQPGRHEASREQIACAERLRELREALSAAFGEVSSCSGCARGHPEPSGHWEGGHCCGGRTLDIFSANEVAALKLAGTRLGRLRPPEGDHAGCAFRGARGCSLAAADRPSICVRYVCPELHGELRGRPDRAALAALTRAIDDERRRFARLMEEAGAEEEGFLPPDRPMVRDEVVSRSSPLDGLRADPRARASASARSGSSR